MSEDRLPTHIEVSALIRATEAAGGFATVVSKGDRDGGVIMILTIEKGGQARLWERMPRMDGTRAFVVVRCQDTENMHDFDDYLARRVAQDSDSWLIELHVPNAEQLVAEFGR